MKKILFVLLCELCCIYGSSQVPAGMPSPPNAGRLYGKVVDSTGRPVGDASVLLLQKKMDSATHKMKDGLIKGTNTQSNGDFNLEGLPVFGQFTLNITAVGYRHSSQPVSLQPKIPAGTPLPAAGQIPDFSGAVPSFETDLGKIRISPDAAQPGRRYRYQYHFKAQNGY